MFNYKDVRTLHLELTDKCNAACPMCMRNIQGGPQNPYLPNKEISLEFFKSAFSPEFLARMKKIYFCGNYGDPALAKDLIPIIEYIRSCNQTTSLGMNTNGGVGSPALWAKLGKLLGPNAYCTFSIDGLEDTNHIYRRHVRWKHVMQSAKAFIAAGGNADWDYIIFKHNEHQVEAAKSLSKELGFKNFFSKKSGRFVFFAGELRIEAAPVYNENLELEYFIEPPSEKNENKVFTLLKADHQKFRDVDKKWELDMTVSPVRNQGLRESYFTSQENDYVSRAKINCRVLKDNSIFISSEGLVFPCCWTAFPINSFWDNNDALQLRELITKTGGRDKIDLNHTPLKDIVNGPFFSEISKGWSSPCAKEGKIAACANQCGEELERLSEENIPY